MMRVHARNFNVSSLEADPFKTALESQEMPKSFPERKAEEDSKIPRKERKSGLGEDIFFSKLYFLFFFFE